MSSMDAMYAMLGAGAIMVVLIAGVIGIVCYVLSALGLMRVGKYLGYTENAWMAWIPFVSAYYLALISSTDDEKAEGSVKMYNTVNIPLMLYNLGFLVVIAIMGVLGALNLPAIVGTLFSVAYYGFLYFRVYSLLNNADPYDNGNSYMVLGILSALIGLIPMVYFLQGRFNTYR